MHLYIHAVEESQDAHRAEKYADRLAELAPTAGHLVHMPAHIYIRVGRYHDSTLNNIMATESDRRFLAACDASLDVYKVGYVPHNWHFGWITAAIEGWSAKAIELAKGTSALIPAEMMRTPGLAVTQHYYMQPSFAYLRFGRWDDVLAVPEPDQDLIYARAIWHYAAGEAELAKGHVDAARAHLDQLAKLRDDPALGDVVFFGINKATDLLAVAHAFLTADVLRRSGDLKGAIDGFETALDRETELKYTEPPDWFYPVRHALGEAQLAAGDGAGAERTYRDDLAIYPENGWSLFGLGAALRAQGKNDEASAVDARFKTAWAHADVRLTATRL
jgi:tetratricopeptide (TPR) repeat protein